MINYGILHDSEIYYAKKGFIRVETPWLVSPAIDTITKPHGIQSYHVTHNNKCLVASAEQSFLYQYLKKYLPLGTFQSITPCFRAETFDFLHSKTFMKNELINTIEVTTSKLDEMVDQALLFFQKYLPGAEVQTTDSGFDIEYRGHELGSYGIRECEFLKWIYGTGVAEPRLSRLINKYRNDK